MADRRWDTDARRHGVADARASLPAIRELEELAATPDWVAEDPESHLMPHLRSGFDAAGMTITAFAVEASGLLTVRVRASARRPAELRSAMWAVLGEVAELSSHVRESHAGELVVFEVVTGVPPGGEFATHGHTLRIEVAAG